MPNASMPYGTLQPVMPQMMPSMPSQFPMYPQAPPMPMPQLMAQPQMMMMPQQQQFVPTIFQQSQQNMHAFAFGTGVPPTQSLAAQQQAVAAQQMASSMGFPPRINALPAQDDDGSSLSSSDSDNSY